MATEPPCFEEFFRALHARLFAGLCLVTGSRQEAEEIMQEAFLQLWQRWDRVSTMADPAGYLFRTAMNVYRKRTRRAGIAARRVLGLAATADEFERIDDRDELIRAMRELTPRERAAIVLTSLHEYSSREAGELLGVSDSTVRVLTSRARQAMRTSLGGGE